jgi:tRNA A-37 threonylcarbamoyl transferase component Bud32
MVRGLGLDDPRRARHFERGELVLDSGVSRVLRFRWPDEDGDLFYFKVYRYYRPRRMFTFTYRKSRTRTEFESLSHLRQAGIPAVEPVAYGSHRVARVIRSCFLITRGVEDSIDLARYLPAFFSRPRTPEWQRIKNQAIRDLAGMVRRMHASGFYDHDLYFRNILTRDVEDGRLRFWFLDHPKGRVIPAARGRERHEARIYDLATLARRGPEFLSKTECLRFFLEATGNERCEGEARQLLHEVAELRKHMLEKQKRTLEKRAAREPRPPREW